MKLKKPPYSGLQQPKCVKMWNFSWSLTCLTCEMSVDCVFLPQLETFLTLSLEVYPKALWIVSLWIASALIHYIDQVKVNQKVWLLNQVVESQTYVWVCSHISEFPPYSQFHPIWCIWPNWDNIPNKIQIAVFSLESTPYWSCVKGKFPKWELCFHNIKTQIKTALYNIRMWWSYQVPMTV